MLYVHNNTSTYELSSHVAYNLSRGSYSAFEPVFSLGLLHRSCVEFH